MKLKILTSGTFRIAAISDGTFCPAEEFLTHGEDATRAARIGLLRMLEEAAKRGLDQLPTGWTHEASKKDKIYEFIKGPLRLFFFKGSDGTIVICTDGCRKSGPKADKSKVSSAARMRDEYLSDYQANNIDFIE